MDRDPKRISRARVMVGTRLHAAEIARIDTVAGRRGLDRAQWLRKAILRVLEAEEGRGVQGVEEGYPGGGGGTGPPGGTT